jgi:hypothetical protein
MRRKKPEEFFVKQQMLYRASSLLRFVYFVLEIANWILILARVVILAEAVLASI